MSSPTKFQQLVKELFPVLVQYVPVVDRVHGEHHPEFHEVRRLFFEVYDKTAASDSATLDLHDEFDRLQKVTQNYAVPDDVCETYEAVYDMLKKLNAAYKA